VWGRIALGSSLRVRVRGPRRRWRGRYGVTVPPLLLSLPSYAESTTSYNSRPSTKGLSRSATSDQAPIDEMRFTFPYVTRWTLS